MEHIYIYNSRSIEENKLFKMMNLSNGNQKFYIIRKNKYSEIVENEILTEIDVNSEFAKFLLGAKINQIVKFPIKGKIHSFKIIQIFS